MKQGTFPFTTVFRNLKTSSKDRNLSLPSNIISRKQNKNTKSLSSKISIPIEYNLKPNPKPQEKEIAIEDERTASFRDEK